MKQHDAFIDAWTAWRYRGLFRRKKKRPLVLGTNGRFLFRLLLPFDYSAASSLGASAASAISRFGTEMDVILTRVYF